MVSGSTSQIFDNVSSKAAE